MHICTRSLLSLIWLGLTAIPTLAYDPGKLPPGTVLGNPGNAKAAPIATPAPSLATGVILPADLTKGITFGTGLLLSNQPSQGVLQLHSLVNGYTTSIHLHPPVTVPTGTISEYTVERTNYQAFGGDYARWSFSALGTDQGNVSGMIGEFGGAITPTEFVWQIGVENPPNTFTSYEPMRLMAGADLGNVAFGLLGPVSRDVIQLHEPNIGAPGTRNSHTILWEGKSNDGAEHAVAWRAFSKPTSNAGAARFTLQYRLDNAAWTTMFEVDSAGVIFTLGGVGVSCSGSPTVNFASVNGIVTHC